MVMFGWLRVSVILAAGPLDSRAIRSCANAARGGRSSRPARRRMPDRVSGGCGLLAPGTRRPWWQRPGGAVWAPRGRRRAGTSRRQARRGAPTGTASRWSPEPEDRRGQPAAAPGGRSGDLDGSAERGADELDEPSAGHRFGGGQVPDPAKGFRPRSQDDQRPGHVGEVVQAVRHVHAAHPAGSVALDGRTEQDVADDAVGPTRSVVVRGASEATWRVPERWAASSRSAMSARMRPFWWSAARVGPR